MMRESCNNPLSSFNAQRLMCFPCPITFSVSFGHAHTLFKFFVQTEYAKVHLTLDSIIPS